MLDYLIAIADDIEPKIDKPVRGSLGVSGRPAQAMSVNKQWEQIKKDKC